MRAVLKAYDVTDRIVWVADSFQGLPKPQEGNTGVDAGDRHWRSSRLAVPIEAVRANFLRYGLLDDQVRFLEGWFKDTLPTAPIRQLAILRLPKVAMGGFVIIDDYGNPIGISCLTRQG